MAADAVVPSTDYSAMAIASRALEKANEIALKQAKLEADLSAHLTWCMRAREEDRAEDRVWRDSLARDDRNWRESLGRRLDRSDALFLKSALGLALFLLSILMGILGWLFSHGKFFG